MLGDAIGDRLSLSLTRMDLVTTGEEITETPEGGVAVQPGKVPESRKERVIEFTAEMRPDQGLVIVNAILGALSKLSADRKRKYNIPANISPIVPIAG